MEMKCLPRFVTLWIGVPWNLCPLQSVTGIVSKTGESVKSTGSSLKSQMVLLSVGLVPELWEGVGQFCVSYPDMELGSRVLFPSINGDEVLTEIRYFVDWGSLESVSPAKCQRDCVKDW